MLITVLEQGLTKSSPNSVGNLLVSSLKSGKYDSFYAFSAFASRAGVNGLKVPIQDAVSKGLKVNMVVGVDQKGTSKAALKAINRLNVNSYVYYQSSPSIYHPKMYFFEGKKESLLIVGSSNLTSQGLFTNIETSVHILLNNALQVDVDFVNKLKATYFSFFSLSDQNLQKINKKLIKNLVDAGIVPTEKERRANHVKSNKVIPKSAKSILKGLFPKRSLSQIPQSFKSKRMIKKGVKVRLPKTAAVGSKKVATSQFNKLLWESSPLTERDLAIPKGSNTNPTGSMLFKKGITAGIDQRHYFRDKVFVNLQWVNDPSPNQHKERAIGSFELWINGFNHGTFNLRISHDTRTNTKTYLQNNSVTQISWGATKHLVGDPNLLGKKLELYSLDPNMTEFKIVIQ